MRRSVVAVVVLSLACLLTACSSSAVSVSSAAPPLVVCGVTLSDSPEGAVMYEITNKDFDHKRPVNEPTVGGVVYVRVASDCEHGSNFTVIPPDAFKTVVAVRAADHLPVVVVLTPLRSVATVLVARQHGRVVGRLRLRISESNFANR
ncbi:MAG: hypothetical protein ACYDGN_14685 [Acidimicrobiales bacterium]